MQALMRMRFGPYTFLQNPAQLQVENRALQQEERLLSGGVCVTPAGRRGRGNAYARGGWWLHDRILTDTTLTVIRADVFARRDLLDPRSGTPLPTYRRQRYTGGIGRYFPIFLYIK